MALPVQVLTRTLCSDIDCHNGKDLGRKKRNNTYEDCESCSGKGYIEEWIDLSTLLNNAITFNG